MNIFERLPIYACKPRDAFSQDAQDQLCFRTRVKAPIIPRSIISRPIVTGIGQISMVFNERREGLQRVSNPDSLFSRSLHLPTKIIPTRYR